MKLLSVDNYVDFNCIGGDCPISCCGGNWGIYLDEESLDKYMSVEGPFGQTLRDGIVKTDDRIMFRLDEKTRDCVFLTKEKLCSIYKNLGSDYLCATCMTYPRMFYQIGDIVFCYLTNSCPEVNRMIMQRNDKMKTLFDDDESQDGEGAESDNQDRTKLNKAFKAFDTGMHIMQNDNISLSDRLFLMTFYIDRFQKIMKDDGDISGLMDIFSKPDIYTMFLENRSMYKNDYAEMIHVFVIIYKSILSESYDHPMWKQCRELIDDIVNKGIPDPKAMEKGFIYTESEDIQNELSQLLIYRYFVTFMQGFSDNDYWDKMVFEMILYSGLITYVALSKAVRGVACTQEDRIIFYSLCGRINHSNNTRKGLVDTLQKEGYYEVDKLLKLLI